MNIRNKVVVAGIPFTWSTNLSDDELREFYYLYAEEIKKPVAAFSLRLNFLEFLDGICLWSANGDEHSVVYRNAHDLEMLNAHLAEVSELREEQEADESVEKVLRATEDAHLREQRRLGHGDPAGAGGHVHDRAGDRCRAPQPRVR